MQAVAEIRAIQPTGPHHLAGYSFGGLVAFAASQLLSQAGYEVGLLALIGTPIAQRYWPLSLFLTSLAMRTRRQLGILAQLRIEPPRVSSSRGL
jgi:thioesterase domain-containing protein